MPVGERVSQMLLENAISKSMFKCNCIVNTVPVGTWCRVTCLSSEKVGSDLPPHSFLK